MRLNRASGVSLCLAFAAAAVLGTASAAHASSLPIKVMTYNTDNGSSPSGQLDTIAAQHPDVVVLQEASYTQLSTYVDGLNSRLGTTAWHGKYARHCKYGTAPTCTTWYDGSVMVLTHLSTLSTDSILIWAADDYQVARASLHMRVALKDGTPVNIFVCHLPAMLYGSFADAEPARDKYVTVFKSWAAGFGGTQLVGGDFNAHPTTEPITLMKEMFADAWALGGSGYGYTHTNPSVTTRLDYWFGNLTGSEKLSAVTVVDDTVHSDHRPVAATYYVPSTTTTSTTSTTSTTATTLLSDSFSSLDRTKWPYGVFTGTTDSTIGLAASGSFTIGPLKASETGSHYNGISTKAYNLTHDGYAYVQLSHTPNLSTTAYAMFTLGSDASDYYRWYESAGALIAEKRIAGAKTTLADVPYDATADQFLRIRRVYDSSTGVEDVVFETAPNNSGVPGTYTVRHREAWNSHVSSSALRVELKAGTSSAVLSPGSASWDNFKLVAY